MAFAFPGPGAARRRHAVAHQLRAERRRENGANAIATVFIWLRVDEQWFPYVVPRDGELLVIRHDALGPETGRVSRDDSLRYEFLADGTGHALAVGRNVHPVQVVTGDQGITLLEVLKTGAVQTIAILMTGGAGNDRH